MLEMLGNTSPHSQALWLQIREGGAQGRGKRKPAERTGYCLRNEASVFQGTGSKTFHMQRATGRKNLINRNEPSDESVAKMLA